MVAVVVVVVVVVVAVVVVAMAMAVAGDGDGDCRCAVVVVVVVVVGCCVGCGCGCRGLLFAVLRRAGRGTGRGWVGWGRRNRAFSDDLFVMLSQTNRLVRSNQPVTTNKEVKRRAFALYALHVGSFKPALTTNNEVKSMYAWHFALSSHSFTTNTDATNIVLFL